MKTISENSIPHLAEQVKLCLQEGHDNGRTSKELAKLFKTSTREIRRAVEEIRQEYAVINLQDGNGYFYPASDEVDLLRKYVGQELHRNKQHLKTIEAAQLELAEMEG